MDFATWTTGFGAGAAGFGAGATFTDAESSLLLSITNAREGTGFGAWETGFAAGAGTTDFDTGAGISFIIIVALSYASNTSPDSLLTFTYLFPGVSINSAYLLSGRNTRMIASVDLEGDGFAKYISGVSFLTFIIPYILSFNFTNLSISSSVSIDVSSFISRSSVSTPTKLNTDNGIALFVR